MFKNLNRYRAVFLAVVISATITIAAFAASEKTSLSGTWINHRAKIIFDHGDTLRINLKLLPSKNGVFFYKSYPIAGMELIKYPADSVVVSGQQLLLVADKTDSTAIISYGVPFVRLSGEKGVFGTWKNVRDLSEIRWDIGLDFIEYNETALDVKTGFQIIKEKHRGTYTVGEANNQGKFYINFEDGVDAVIFPIVFSKIMYIFDITPRRALFSAQKEIPKADTLKTGVVAVIDTTVKK